MTPSKRMLYRLLYDALIEMRVISVERGDKRLVALADVFHTIPLQLDRLDRDELSVQDIMRKLQEHARRDGIEQWLNHRMEEIAKYHPETMAHENASQ